MYQIIRYEATYCPIRGGLNGSRAVRLPMAYSNKRLADKICERLYNDAYNHCSDDFFKVVEYGADAYSHLWGFKNWPTDSSDVIPF